MHAWSYLLQGELNGMLYTANMQGGHGLTHYTYRNMVAYAKYSHACNCNFWNFKFTAIPISHIILVSQYLF